MDNPDQVPRRLFLVSTPRTASNLLVRVLNIQHQPKVITNDKSGYFFFQPYTVATAKGYFTKPAAEWTADQKAEIRALFQQSIDGLEALSERAKAQSKTAWTKEHAFWFVDPAKLDTNTASNPDSDSDSQEQPFSLTFPDIYGGPNRTFSKHNNTLFPDEYLLTWKFAFLIRHPALVFPSMHRALKGLSELGMLGEQGVALKAAEQTNMTWKWTRDLYQWCCEHQPDGPNNPVILDAHDIIHDPRVVLKFCEETGLDKSVLEFEWEGGVDFGKDGVKQAAVDLMTVTLRGSRGVIKDKAPVEIDIGKEAMKWKEEFGAEIAEELERAVRGAMPDYEFLKERRLKVTG